MVLDDQLNTNSAWSSTQKPRKHEDPLNTNAMHYDPLSTNAMHYDPLSTNAMHYDPPSTNAMHYDPPSTNAMHYDPPSTNAMHYDPPNTNAMHYDPPNTNAMHYDPPSTNAMHYDPPSTNAMHYDPPSTNAMHYDPPRTDIASSSAYIILVTATEANRPATLHFPQDWRGAELHSPDDNLRALRQALARAPQACDDLTHLHDVLQTHHLNHGVTHIWNIPKVKATCPESRSLSHAKHPKSRSHLKCTQSWGHCHIWKSWSVIRNIP